jgi:hypothetical protein
MHNTTACSGGFRYKPTTSISFSSKCGSLDSWNVVTRCGLSPRADHTRCTVSLETPTRWAIVRVLQCVCPAGVECWVNSTISSTTACEIIALRPRPGATCANLVSPCASNRARQARTVIAVTPTCSAIRVFATPPAANNNARDRCTMGRGPRDRQRLQHLTLTRRDHQRRSRIRHTPV